MAILSKGAKRRQSSTGPLRPPTGPEDRDVPARNGPSDPPDANHQSSKPCPYTRRMMIKSTLVAVSLAGIAAVTSGAQTTPPMDTAAIDQALGATGQMQGDVYRVGM